MSKGRAADLAKLGAAQQQPREAQGAAQLRLQGGRRVHAHNLEGAVPESMRWAWGARLQEGGDPAFSACPPHWQASLES